MIFSFAGKLHHVRARYPNVLFAISVSLLGSLIVIRIFDTLVARQLFTRDELTKIGTCYFFSVVVLAIVSPASHLWTWFSVFLPLLVLSFALLALISRRATDFRTRVGEALAVVSLKMKSGRSFRQSLSEAISECDPRTAAKLAEIASSVVFSQQTDLTSTHPFISEVIDELRRIDRQPHLAARRLAVFREKIRLEDDFRRRSGQVLARIRAQSLIMSGLFIAIACFVALKFGFQPNIKLFVCAGSLFLAGALWIWMGGRRLKWKV